MSDEGPDSMLLDFLASLQDYTPTIPDELAEYYLSRSGFQSPDIRVTRLLTVVAQKFIGDIASDALEYCKIRQQASGGKKGGKSRGEPGKDNLLVLTIADLASALPEYSGDIKRQEYFTDSPTAGVTPPEEKVEEKVDE